MKFVIANGLVSVTPCHCSSALHAWISQTSPNCDRLERQTHFLIDCKSVKLLTFHFEKVVNEVQSGDISKCFEITSHCTLFTHVVRLAFVQTSEPASFSGVIGNVSYVCACVCIFGRFCRAVLIIIASHC